ncbi:hypothetical protein GCM10025868_41330 [Angustibacter aerolatus]|uniref:Sodium/calcium exchanger membrane region domain-containing protein n=1 Tax=Angustibacter aerolatus TaxID=1162965 RepID=A0ABQ6JLK1_9ACTN|nr:flagellar assembly protein FliW [Angustibacter aerolatus]GMA88883.1 hypothetical protein GCM10025868_41330 [Angustibacter aerolatus]
MLEPGRGPAGSAGHVALRARAGSTTRACCSACSRSSTPTSRLVVAAPTLFFGDYSPEIDEDTAASIGLSDTADALLLVVVTVGASLADSTANLLAPIVVNAATRQAVQVLQARVRPAGAGPARPRLTPLRTSARWTHVSPLPGPPGAG